MLSAYFTVFALIAGILWITGIGLLLFEHHAVMVKFAGRIAVLLGSTALSVFLLLVWLKLDRPPILTVGETRLWFCVFFTILGYLIYLRWKHKAVLILSIVVAISFLWINFRYPEAFEKNLAPALQSPWFVPHVIVYISSYALLGTAALIAITGMFLVLVRKFETVMLNVADNLVNMGFSLLTIGILLGAIWAKEVWGHYWTWDPKETLSLFTWLVYVLYIHFRYHFPDKTKTHLLMISASFLILLVSWLAPVYLPLTHDSMHFFIR